jgi:membrane associated rhomboid family serine protease
MRNRNDTSAIPDIIFALLIANGLVFALQQMSPRFLLDHFALWPVAHPLISFQPWQLLTHGFMHGNINHILFNMFGLWMFGRDLERLWGSQRFLIYFLVCVVGAGLIQLLAAAFQGSYAPTVGASGGLFGLLLAYGLIFPNRTIVMIMFPVPIRARTAVFIFAAIELITGFSGIENGIANFAHLGGMLFGFLMLQYWQRSRRR